MRAVVRLLALMMLLVVPAATVAQDPAASCAMNLGQCPGQWIGGVGATGCECRCPDGRMATGYPRRCDTDQVQQPTPPPVAQPVRPPPQLPQTVGGVYGAIAYSPATGKLGYSWRFATREEAETAARNFCAESDCTIATWFGENCGALATGPSGWGGDFGPDVTAARTKALRRCSQHSSNCRVVRWVCSKTCTGDACSERNTTGE